MITLEQQTEVSRLEGRLFVTLRPFRRPGEADWTDPVDLGVARLVSEEVSRRDGVLPFERSGGRIFVAAVNPFGPAAISITEFLDGKVILCRVEPEDLMHAQDRVFGLRSDLLDRRLGAHLVQSGRVSADDLSAALNQQSIDASGARIGSILTQRGAATHWDIAEAVARQWELPLIDLLSSGNLPALLCDSSLLPAWGVVNERFWFRHLVVPLSMDGETLTIAMVDPEDEEAKKELEYASGKALRLFVTGYRDVMAALTLRFRHEHEEESRVSLLRRRPEDSAYRQLSRAQAFWLIGGALAVAAGFVVNPIAAGTVLAAIAEVVYGATSVFRLWAMQKATATDSEFIVTKADLSGIPPASLPEYTVLVPLYKESEVLPTLTEAIQNLQYPKDRLDVKFLLEEDDTETIEAARKANLPSYIELLLVPASEPRTKPKACNFGLTHARGEYLVIYDAEDIPEPEQLLKAVTVFRQSRDEKLACVQAKLSYYNERQNILTRWFTAEYANWFELLLPALFMLKMPIPLGGSSNHFRTEILRELGAWDPFNVTEDADLGVRLHKANYRTAVVNSVTYEEANSDFVNWIRQRSRWVKGYLQTWLVHMRHPVRLWKELGPSGFLGFQMTVGGTPIQFLMNPVLWGLTLVWFLFQPPFMLRVFSGWVYYVASLCLFLGNVAFVYTNIGGVARSGRWGLAKWALLSPVYWVFMSIASYKALFQLIFRPSYWEKTVHGLSNVQGQVVRPLPAEPAGWSEL